MNKENLNNNEGVFESDKAGSDKRKTIFLAEDSYATKLVKRTLLDAVDRGASDVFIEPAEENVRIRYRIDGLLCEAGSGNLKYTSSIISCFKIIANLDIAEHRFPQDGRFRMSLSEKPIDFRVSVLPTSLGERVVLRVLDRSKVKLSLSNLGFEEEDLSVLARNLKKSYGMILVCGPTGCGKTTTLYASLNQINSVGVNIVTVEDPVEYQLPGVNQVAVHDDIGLTFPSVLRAALRQDPDIIMVGEIRDFETADTAVKASLTGHLVLSTLHTNTATGAIIRFINMGIEPFLMASACLMTASQVLLRKFCSNCKEEVKAPEALMGAFRENNIVLPHNFKYYKPLGCRFCNNTGFSGRIGVSEILELNPVIKEMLIAKKNETDIRKAAINNGMKTLRQKALMKVAQGLTNIEEVYRVTI